MEFILGRNWLLGFLQIKVSEVMWGFCFRFRLLFDFVRVITIVRSENNYSKHFVMKYLFIFYSIKLFSNQPIAIELPENSEQQGNLDALYRCLVKTSKYPWNKAVKVICVQLTRFWVKHVIIRVSDAKPLRVPLEIRSIRQRRAKWCLDAFAPGKLGYTHRSPRLWLVPT